MAVKSNVITEELIFHSVFYDCVCNTNREVGFLNCFHT